MDGLKEICIDENEKIIDVMRKIDSNERKTMFVVHDKDIFVGIVNDGDIRRGILKGIDKSEPISKIMNKDPITDVETAKKRIQYIDTSYVLVPLLDSDGKIYDCTIITKEDLPSTGINPYNYKKVLVIGGAGYLGSILCRKLLENGFSVRVLDNLLYGDSGIQELYKNPKFELFYGDIRNMKILVNAISGVDAVIHLAAIVGDPASALDPVETIEINYLSSKMVAEVCKFCEVNRLIFASTCSVYGASEHGKLLTETSELNPVSLYAKMKLKSENAILEIADGNFKPTIFRMATLHGLSKRMRFDLAVNIMTIRAAHGEPIEVYGGKQMRAFCNVEDAADCYISCLSSPISDIGSSIINIATENISISNLAYKIRKVVPSANIEIKDIVDERDYIVSGELMYSKLDSLFTQKHIRSIERTIKDITKNKNIYKDFKDKKYSNVEYLRET